MRAKSSPSPRRRCRLRFAPDTLKTLGVFGYGAALTGQISTAHPHYDAKRACHYNYIADLGMKSVYRLCRIGDDGTQFELAAIPVERPAYMHSFGMSADHLILTEFPMVVNPIDLRLSGKPFIQNYRWEAERGLLFHVVEKDTGRLVRTARADASFAFHHVNAFADAGGIAVDVIVYPDATIIDQLYLARLRAGTPITAVGKLTRFQIPLASEAPVTRRTLADLSLELPRINYERHAGKPYRYVWGTGIAAEGDFLDCIVKIDTTTGASARWYAAGLYPGEPVFVPSPFRRRRGRRGAAVGRARHRQGPLLPARARRGEPRGAGAGGGAACHPLPFPWQFLREQASLGLTWGPSSPTFRPEFKAAPLTEPPP